jgi:hypothetical protein
VPVASARLATASPNEKYKWARLCRHPRGLTLPSRGHTTAGHDCALRQHRRRRRVPLMSNVRPRTIRMRSVPRTVENCRTVLSRVAGCFGALNDMLVASARAVRPLAAGEPTATCRRLLQHRRGLSVLRRPAYCRFGPEEGSKLARVQTLGLREEELAHQRQNNRRSFSHATRMRLAGPAGYRSAGPLRPCRHRLRPCR